MENINTESNKKPPEHPINSNHSINSNRSIGGTTFKMISSKRLDRIKEAIPNVRFGPNSDASKRPSSAPNVSPTPAYANIASNHDFNKALLTDKLQAMVSQTNQRLQQSNNADTRARLQRRLDTFRAIDSLIRSRKITDLTVHKGWMFDDSTIDGKTSQFHELQLTFDDNHQEIFQPDSTIEMQRAGVLTHSLQTSGQCTELSFHGVRSYTDHDRQWVFHYQNIKMFQDQYNVFKQNESDKLTQINKELTTMKDGLLQDLAGISSELKNTGLREPWWRFKQRSAISLHQELVQIISSIPNSNKKNDFNKLKSIVNQLLLSDSNKRGFNLLLNIIVKHMSLYEGLKNELLVNNPTIEQCHSQRLTDFFDIQRIIQNQTNRVQTEIDQFFSKEDGMRELAKDVHRRIGADTPTIVLRTHNGEQLLPSAYAGFFTQFLRIYGVELSGCGKITEHLNRLGTEKDDNGVDIMTEILTIVQKNCQDAFAVLLLLAQGFNEEPAKIQEKFNELEQTFNAEPARIQGKFNGINFPSMTRLACNQIRLNLDNIQCPSVHFFFKADIRNISMDNDGESPQRLDIQQTISRDLQAKCTYTSFKIDKSNCESSSQCRKAIAPLLFLDVEKVDERLRLRQQRRFEQTRDSICQGTLRHRAVLLNTYTKTLTASQFNEVKQDIDQKEQITETFNDCKNEQALIDAIKTYRSNDFGRKKILAKYRVNMETFKKNKSSVIDEMGKKEREFKNEFHAFNQCYTTTITCDENFVSSASNRKNKDYCGNLHEQQLMNSKGECLFKSFRHAVITSSDKNNPDAIIKKKVIHLARTIMKDRPTTTPVHITSISLLTPAKKYSEEEQLNNQLKAFERLTDLTDDERTEYSLPEFTISAFNFGVNEFEYFGRTQALKKRNDTAIETFFEKVREKLDGLTDDKQTLATRLMNDIQARYDRYNQGPGKGPYKCWKADQAFQIAVRISYLTQCIDEINICNCRSGKDRTGMYMSLALNYAIQLDNHPNDITDCLDNIRGNNRQTKKDIQNTNQQFLLHTGQQFIQTKNTGSPGYKLFSVPPKNMGSPGYKHLLVSQLDRFIGGQTEPFFKELFGFSTDDEVAAYVTQHSAYNES